MSRPARSWRLNPRAAAVLSLVAVALLGLAAGLWFFQARAGRAGALLRMAETLAKAGPKQDDLAIAYLDEALARDPELVAALDLKAELLARSGHSVAALNEAFQLGSRALRLAPDGPAAQATRRRQVELALQLAPLVTSDQGRLAAAEPLARERIDRGARDADAWRLLARVEVAAGDKASLDRAVRDFETARKLDPRDPETAAHLAILYRDHLHDPDRAARILDELLAAGDSATTRRTRHQFYAAAGHDLAERGQGAEAEAAYRRADTELERAKALAPDDPELRLIAAIYQLDRGRIAAARADLDRIPAEGRDNYRYRLAQGLIDLHGHRNDEAIAAWRRGLLATGGTSIELTWQLAFVLLNLGRLDEAAPLIEQYQRLADGPETPPARFLQALRLRQRNQPVEAIKILEVIRHKADRALAPLVYYQLGRCAEAIHDEAAALGHYRRALQLDGQYAAARLQLVRMLQARHPEQAAAEARKGGGNPALLVALARMELRRQRATAADRRDFTTVERLLAEAAAKAPAAPDLLVAQADLLDATGRPEEALKRLEAATRDRQGRTEPALWLARAERLLRLGRADEAARVLEQAGAPDAAGDQVKLREARAKLMTLRGRGEEARTMLVADLDRLPPDQRPDAWKALANLYAGQHRGEEARRAYARWAELLPEDPVPRLFLFALARNAGDAASAAEQLKRLKDIGGAQGPEFRVARALELLDAVPGESARAKADRLASAEALIGRIEADDPELWYGPMLRGQYLAGLGRLNEAAQAFEKALERGAVPVLPRLVKLYAEQGRTADLDRLRRAHGVELPGMDRLAAESALKRGDKVQAEALARRVIAGDPESLDLRRWHSRVLGALGQPAEAEATLRELIARRPTEPGPWLALLALQAERRNAAETAPDAAAPTTEQVRETVARMRAQVKTEKPEFFEAQAWRLAGERGRAASAFEAALSRWADDPIIVRAAADFYGAIGRPADADRILEEARRRDPAARWATRQLAVLRSEQAGGRPEAWRAAWALLAETPAEVADAPEERLAHAFVLANGPEPAQRRDAAEILRRLVGDLPADLPAASQARRTLSRLELKDDHPDRAADALAGDAEAADATPAVLVPYIEALTKARRFETADKALGRLETIEPGGAAAVLLRAELLRARGQEAAAVALLERDVPERLKAAAAPDAAANAGPEAEGAARLACERLEAWKQSEAADRLAAILAEARPGAAWVQALLRANRGRLAEALAGLQKAADAVAEPDLLVNIARDAIKIATDAGKASDPALIDAAAAVLATARRRLPNNPELIALEGNIRHFQGRHEDAIRAFNDALQGAGDDPRALNNLAWTLAVNLGRPTEALSRIEQAIRRGGPQPGYLDTRGVVYTRLGKLPEAIRDLEEATHVPSPKATHLAHLALAYHQAGRLDDFHRARDQARAAGLTPAKLDPAERAAGAALFED